MRIVAHAAASATAFLCLLGVASASTPAAAEGSPSATMLAAITAPIAVAPALNRPDFSAAAPADQAEGDPAADSDTASAKPTTTLAALVADRLASDTRDDEHECLATTVYFESKGQPLDGQLAVAETILNRTESGRFPTSACGVVKQRGQFGFVRHGSLPSAPRASRAWKEAVAVAAVAREKLWHEVAREALYFNTGRAPSPRLTRVARFGPQVFYR